MVEERIAAAMDAVIRMRQDTIVDFSREKFLDMLHLLTPEEEDIFKLRFGITDGKIHSLEQLEKIYKVSRQRIRQIEHKALKQLGSMNI